MATLNESKLNIKIKKILVDATMPTKAFNTDAGLDLYAAESIMIDPHETAVIDTGISMAIPEGWYGQIEDRSSMGYRSLNVLGGVIDASYRGPIKVMLHNCLSNSIQEIKKGHKIAQMIFLPVPEIEITEVEELEETDRGNKGFGSSGQ